MQLFTHPCRSEVLRTSAVQGSWPSGCTPAPLARSAAKISRRLSPNSSSIHRFHIECAGYKRRRHSSECSTRRGGPPAPDPAGGALTWRRIEEGYLLGQL